VTGSKIKQSAITSPKVRDGSLLARDFAPGQLPQGVPGPQGERGPQGEQGPPGTDATRLFAYIRDFGSSNTANVKYASGVTAVDDPDGDGPYRVTFDRSLANCVVLAQAGAGDPDGLSASQPAVSSVFMPVGTDAQVRVTFETDAGTVIDTAFLIAAFC
jgi:hypothetical protein